MIAKMFGAKTASIDLRYYGHKLKPIERRYKRQKPNISLPVIVSHSTRAAFGRAQAFTPVCWEAQIRHEYKNKEKEQDTHDLKRTKGRSGAVF